MHPNPAYRQQTQARNLAFLRERGFGTLTINADPSPLISHIPFVLDEEGTGAELHLVRSNPIARAVTVPTPAALAVTGPDGYISPDWYGDKAQVPTWNYVAVHLRGTLRPLDPSELRGQLERLVASFETRLLPKTPWTMGKTPDEVLDKLLRMILPFRFQVEQIDSTWKLAQNKSEAARLGAAAQLQDSAIGQETAILAELMREALRGE